MRRSNAGWVYILDSNIEAHREDDYRIFKIGRATNLKSRVKHLGTAYAYKPTIAYAFFAQDCIAAEAELHELFQPQRLNGEWFRLGYEDLTFISDYAENAGYFEDVKGRLLPDPLMPYSESDRLKACIAELEEDCRLAARAKYFPLETRLDLPVCPLEIEEIISDADLTESADYEAYLEECRLQEEEEERLQMEREQFEHEQEELYAAEYDEGGGEEDWDHGYTDPKDKAFVSIQELIRGRMTEIITAGGGQ